MSKFVPSNKAELKALVALCGNPVYNKQRAEALASAEFNKCANKLREIHQNLFADSNNPLVIAHYKGKANAWKVSGLTAKCHEVAEQFQLPHWDVAGAANSFCN